MEWMQCDLYRQVSLHLWSSSDDVLDEDDSDNGYDDDWNVVDCRSMNPSQPYHFWIIFWNSNLFVDSCCRTIMLQVSTSGSHFDYPQQEIWTHFRLLCFSPCFSELKGFLLGNHPNPIADNNCFTRTWFSPTLSLSPLIEKTENSNHFLMSSYFSSWLDWVSCVSKTARSLLGLCHPSFLRRFDSLDFHHHGGRIGRNGSSQPGV